MDSGGECCSRDMQVGQAACLQDAQPPWRRKAAHLPSQHSKRNPGKHLVAGILLQLRERRGAGCGATETVFVQVTNALHRANAKGHLPGFVVWPSLERWARRPTPLFLRALLPSPGVPPPSLAPLSAFAPPSLLRQWSYSSSLDGLTVFSSAQPTGPLHLPAFQPLSGRCSEVNSSYPHPPAPPPFTQWLEPPKPWCSSLISPFFSAFPPRASAGPNSSLLPNISNLSTFPLLYPSPEGATVCCLDSYIVP